MTDAIGPPVGGYRAPARYRVVHGAEGSQFAGLWAEIRSNLLGGELDALNDNEQTWLSVEALMAPWVVAWNLTAPTKVRREEPIEPGPDGTPRTAVTVSVADEPLPPPAEAGPGVFRRVDVYVKVWLRSQLAAAPFMRGDESLKPQARSAATPSGSPDGTAPVETGEPSPTPSRP